MAFLNIKGLNSLRQMKLNFGGSHIDRRESGSAIRCTANKPVITTARSVLVVELVIDPSCSGAGCFEGFLIINAETARGCAREQAVDSLAGQIIV